MKAFEPRIGKTITLEKDHTVTISYALVKYESTWFAVVETRGKGSFYYLSRIMNDLVNISEGFIFIDAPDTLTALQDARVIGSLSKSLHNFNQPYDETQPENIRFRKTREA